MSETEQNQVESNLFPRVRIVLVETTHPGNIGATARAMKNMGLYKLVLVSPHLFPSEKAIWRSASAADVVEGAQVVSSLEEALEGCQLVIGTSARERRIPWPMLEPKSCGEKVFKTQAAGKEVAIVFGREAHGLKNEELQMCHFHVNIPTGKAYSSLNLGMAVQVLTYEILQASIAATDQSDQASQEDDAWDMDYATSDALEHFFVHLESTLVETGFHDPENPRQLMTRLRRMFNRIRMDEMEVNILRGFLTSINHLKAKKPE
ncbi:MAG: tRNA (cytosine(32)/uridine(32)-2'-O)-methyltransferase TrmJ [Pseudomonadales bacterium]|nr:tRNA (cytosine(32)/uridine(32)-2'-O)-methyltransferase TrmJ [Pseudomonadales bacterium]